MNPGRPGAAIRTDLVDGFLFRRPGGGDQPAFLELHRTERPGALMPNTWQPVMGHTEPGETSIDCLVREVAEETGLDIAAALGVWQLESVVPFYIAARDEIYLSPRFVIEVGPTWEPTLNEEHDQARWTRASVTRARGFTWPHQRAAVDEIMELIVDVTSPVRDALRIALPS